MSSDEDHGEIDELLKCQLCSEYAAPKLLPCQELICETCSGKVLTRYAELTEFRCPICRKYHKMPEDGTFPTNYVLLKLFKENIEIKSQLEAFKHSLQVNRNKIDELGNSINSNGVNIVKDLCRNLRMDIRQHTEDKINSIYRLEESLLMKVDEYEAESINHLEDVNIDDIYPYDLVNEFDNFNLEWEINLRKTRYNRKILKQATRSLAEIQTEIESESSRINQVIFNNQVCTFKKNEDEFEESMFGALELMPMVSEVKLRLVIDTPEELQIEDLTVMDNGDLAACSMNSTWNLIWNMETGERRTNIGEHADSVSCLVMLNNGNLCSGSRDNTVKTWSMESGELLDTFEGTEAVSALVILDDGNICAGFQNGTINVWDAESGDVVEFWRGHSVTLRGLRVLSDGRILSYDHYTIKIWRDLGDLEKKVYAFDMTTLVASNDGNVYIGSKEILILDTNSGDFIGKWSGHTEQVTALAILNNGDLCSGYTDGTVQIMDTNNGRVKRTFKAHDCSVKAVRILQDDSICTCAHDNTIKVWQCN